MKKRRILSLMTAAALLVSLLGSCGMKAGETSEEVSGAMESSASSEVSRVSSEPSSEISEVSEEPQIDLGPCNPLTGETDYPEEALGKRPVAVMVNNIGQALPQRGLAAADLIYEVVTEGGITRLMAVYANPDEIPYVGPVRSVRHYYVAMALPYDPIFVHFGGSPAGYSYIADLGVDDVDGMNYTSAFYQDTWRAAQYGREHSFFIDGENIAAVAEKRGYETEGEPLPLFDFAVEPLEPEATDAAKVFVPFSSGYNAEFTYQPDTGLYTKKRNGADHIDADTEEVLTFTNVLILYTSVTAYNGEAQRREVALQGGSGWYVTASGRYAIKWSKGASANQFSFTLEDGTPLEANRGKTYICVTDSSNAANTVFTAAE